MSFHQSDKMKSNNTPRSLILSCHISRSHSFHSIRTSGGRWNFLGQKKMGSLSSKSVTNFDRIGIQMTIHSPLTLFLCLTHIMIVLFLWLLGCRAIFYTLGNRDFQWNQVHVILLNDCKRFLFFGNAIKNIQALMFSLQN